MSMESMIMFPDVAPMQRRIFPEEDYNAVYTQSEIDYCNSYLNFPWNSPSDGIDPPAETELLPFLPSFPASPVPHPEDVATPDSDYSGILDVIDSFFPSLMFDSSDIFTSDEILTSPEEVIISDANMGYTQMIPDTARSFSDLSDSVSKPSFISDFNFSDFFNCDDVRDLDHILRSDTPLDEDLYPSNLDEDLYPGVLNNDENLYYNLQEELYQEKLGAPALEVSALKSYQVVFSPELCPIVNPNEVIADQRKEIADHKEIKIEVTDEFQLNNTRKSKDGQVVPEKKKEVHNDHSYVIVEGKVLVKVEVEEEEEVVEEEYIPKNVVVKIEAPAAKRPVGRPRKTPIATKPLKRSAHYDEINEEIVDVESIDVKRPRKAPKAKPAKAPAKRKVTKPSISSEESCSPSHFQAIDPLNPNGYVMRQAKTSALKKITKTKKGPSVSRSKRSDHNDMERKRRHEMRDLFEELKMHVPTELLVDDNNKIKKNPSKNTILVGSRKYIEILYGHKTSKNSLVRQNQKLQKRRRKLEKSLRKRCKKIMSRRNIC